MNFIVSVLAFIFFTRELDLADKWWFWGIIAIFLLGLGIVKIVRFYLKKAKTGSLFNQQEDIGKQELKRQVDAIYKGHNL